MLERRFKFRALIILVLAGAIASCSTKAAEDDVVTPIDIPAAAMSYIVLAWNDLGMHFFNPTYDQEVLLPPF